ncbi:MAG: hypothetical protein R6U95_10180 [Bacteroidales bacterium]
MNSPIAIIDARAPQEAKEKLSQFFSVHEFMSRNTTYKAIEGHPDVFMCQIAPNKIIYAPNTPIETQAIIRTHAPRSTIGAISTGKELHNSTPYNCIVTKHHLFHKQDYTDTIIKQKCIHTEFIHLPQAYTRCSMIQLPDGACITSDQGIVKQLQKTHIPHIYCKPETIHLPPYKHGFIGGTMGVFNNTVYCIGSLHTLKNNSELRQFIHNHKCTIVELYNGPLYDGGGIFFIST